MTENTLRETIAEAKAVLFDLFHTLTALETTWGDGRPFTYQALGVSKQAWDEQLHKNSHDRLIGKQTDAVAIVAGMARAIDPTISEEVIRAATANRIARFSDALIHMPLGTGQVIAALKSSGKRIGLISNADVMEVAAWSQCPFAALFDSAIFSCAVGCAKPEPEIYRISLRELGIKAGEAVFVGDGGGGELRGARAVGLTTVMITGIIRELWPERIDPLQRDADYVIEHLTELTAG